MSFFTRFFSTVISTAVVTAFSLVVVHAMLPSGQSIKDLPSVIKQIRQRTPNPVAKRILDLILGDEQKAMTAANQKENEDFQRSQQDVYLAGEESAGLSIGAQTSRTIDPRALEAIDKMLVSDEIKRQMKRSYLETGELRGIKLAPSEEEPEETRKPAAAAPVPQPGIVWPTRSLQAVVAVTAGAFTYGDRPRLSNGEFEIQAETLLSKIHAEIAIGKPPAVMTTQNDRELADTTESLIKALDSVQKNVPDSDPETRTD